MHISGTTALLGLIGTPVEHSKSPAMYNHCFAQFGLDWAYLAFDVPPERAGAAVQAIRTLNMRGANVTMPCKNAVIPYLDRITPAAQAIQAVNTIVNEDGVLVGHNTDGCGYTQNLRRSGVEVAGKKIVLLGGGGAASAIAIQSALEGAAEIAVFNLRDEFWPRVEQGLAAISAAAPGCAITLRDLDDKDALKDAIDHCDILSNATRVGMAPFEDQSVITDRSWFRPDLIVTDVVYSPAETKMLREAKAAGCRTCDGLGMLLCQGAEAFRLYSGLEMPVEEIRALLYT
jgi:quinate/shikimate dehydrogenase